jgi:hypothetical protein
LDGCVRNFAVRTRLPEEASAGPVDNQADGGVASAASPGTNVMSALELTITALYLLAMLGYGHLCYVQGVMDRDQGERSGSVRNALRFGRRYLDPSAAPSRPGR